jgi:hypothetical protein
MLFSVMLRYHAVYSVLLFVSCYVVLCGLFRLAVVVSPDRRVCQCMHSNDLWQVTLFFNFFFFFFFNLSFALL